MTKKQLIERLKQLAKSDDTEEAHSHADDLLLEYIDDAQISEAYDAIDKWYA